MKKTLLWQLLMLLIPFGAFAQADPPVLKGVIKKANKFTSFKLNDNTCVFASSLGEETETFAISDQMQMKWQSKLKGSLVFAGSFHGEALIVTSTGEGNDQLYQASLLKSYSGQVLESKSIYSTGKQNEEVLKFYLINAETSLKMVIRQTGRQSKSGMNNGSSSYGFYETKALSISDIDQSLSVKGSVPLNLNTGTLFNVGFTDAGVALLSWVKKDGIEIEKFEQGRSDKSVMTKLDLTFAESYATFGAYPTIVLNSKNDPDVVYITDVIKRKQGDYELYLAKLNFATGKQQIIFEKIDKNMLKKLRDTYALVNKQVGYPGFGTPGGMTVGQLTEDNGDLVLVKTSSLTRVDGVVMGGAFFGGMSSIMSVYGSDLKLKTRQVIPSYFVTNNYTLSTLRTSSANYLIRDRKLFYLANAKSGSSLGSVILGVVDLNDGKHLKQDYLSNQEIQKQARMEGNAMWFENKFIVPYAIFKNGTEEDISFQLNSY